MAFEKVGATLPAAEAAADLTGAQFLLVKTTSTGVNKCGAGDHADGVLQNKPNTGQAATVWGPGSVSKVIAGAAVAKGADVASDANAKGITSTTGDYIVGRALTAVSNADEILSVWITNPGRTA